MTAAQPNTRPGTPEAATEAYRAARTAFLAMSNRADAAFARYFARLQAGERTSGAAAAHLANEANYLSAIMYQAQGGLYQLDLDPWDIDDADGIERMPVG